MFTKEVVLYVLGYFEVLAEKTTTTIDDSAVRFIKFVVADEVLFQALLKLLNISGQENRRQALETSPDLAALRVAGDDHGYSSWVATVLQFVSLVRAIRQLMPA